ncbi:hypothetical protein NN6n1_19360 [Shinella zoogloeoides]
MAGQSGERTVVDEDCMKGSLPQAARRPIHIRPPRLWEAGGSAEGEMPSGYSRRGRHEIRHRRSSLLPHGEKGGG